MRAVIHLPIGLLCTALPVLLSCAPAGNTPVAAPAAPASVSEVLAGAKVIDLSHPMYPGMPIWPGGVPFTMTRLVDYDAGYRLHKFELGENTGTHMDAPAHFFAGKRPIDGIAPRELVVAAAVIDIQAKVAENPDYELSAADVTAWEAAHGPVPAGALVIANTGWHKRFADPARYVNMDANQVMHFPGFGEDSAKLLLARNVAGIGIDTLSLDNGPSQSFATHKVMLGAGKYQLENMANLDALPATGATVVIGVLPVHDGTQAQARVLAIVPASSTN